MSSLVAPAVTRKVGGHCTSAHVMTVSMTVARVATFMAQAHALICSHWALPPAAPLYIVVHTVDGANWGYGGLSQQARRQAGAPL